MTGRRQGHAVCTCCAMPAVTGPQGSVCLCLHIKLIGSAAPGCWLQDALEPHISKVYCAACSTLAAGSLPGSLWRPGLGLARDDHALFMNLRAAAPGHLEHALGQAPPHLRDQPEQPDQGQAARQQDAARGDSPAHPGAGRTRLARKHASERHQCATPGRSSRSLGTAASPRPSSTTLARSSTTSSTGSPWRPTAAVRAACPRQSRSWAAALPACWSEGVATTVTSVCCTLAILP